MLLHHNNINIAVDRIGLTCKKMQMEVNLLQTEHGQPMMLLLIGLKFLYPTKEM
jgi:hypothetical protein